MAIVENETNAVILDKRQVLALVDDLNRCLGFKNLESVVLTFTDRPEVKAFFHALARGDTTNLNELPGPRFVFVGSVFTVGTAEPVGDVLRGMGFDPKEAGL